MSTTLNDIEDKIKDIVSEVMVNEVREKAVQQLIDSATEIIYDAYDPKDYVRRKSFEDEKAYSVNSPDYMELTIEAEAKYNNVGNVEANSGNLAELIYEGDESGSGSYGWMPPNDREPTYLNPRPWIDDAREKIDKNKVLKKAVANALKSYGFKVR